jgi:PAS domain S-box-containing protein
MDAENHSLIGELNSRIEAFNPILDLVDTIFVVIDEHYIIRLINKKGCSVFGYEKVEMEGKYPADFVLPSNQDKLNTRLGNLFNSESNPDEYTEFPFITKNGQEIIINWHNTYLRDNNGKIIFVLKSGEDVTKVKREEKIQITISRILSASNSEVNIDELFKFIHSSVKELMPAENFYIALFDKESHEIRFPYFIDEYDKIAPTKRMGRGLTEFVIRKGQSMLITEDVHKELEREGEIELIGPPSKIWLGVPLSIQNNIIGVLVVQNYDDENTYGEKEKEILELISYPTSRAIERKLLEHEREDLINKLKKLNDSKDRLFTLISHDLRSPFNSLLGFSEILATEYNTLSREEIKEYLNVIYESSKNLYGMTNNLLQFSRFQMGRMEFDPVILDIKDMLTHSLKLLRGNTIKKQINVISSVPKDIKVNADEDMLNSIFQNLISNAVKFTPKGGDIFISAKKITTTDNKNMVQIVIRDTGIGISEDLMDKIFKDHVLSSPGTEREYGTGLGLLIVKEFVERNSGQITVISRLNEGSTFSLTLPLSN